MMKPICSEWEERLSLYVDGLLNPFDENAVEAHLSRCEACRQAVALWREVGQTIRRLPRVLPPPDLRARIFASTTRKPSLLQRVRLGWWSLAPAVAAGLMLAWWTLPRMPVQPFSAAHLSREMPSGEAASPRPAEATSEPLVESPAHMEVARRPADKDTPIVIVVQPASTPRWQEPSPRWVAAPRAPAPQSNPPANGEPIALATPQDAAPVSSNAPALITAIADLPVETPASSEPGTAGSAEPATPGTEKTPHAVQPAASATHGALSQWSEQFNRQLQRENRLLRQQALSRRQRDSRFFVPIFSWNIK